jgi:hypothetical protein
LRMTLRFGTDTDPADPHRRCIRIRPMSFPERDLQQQSGD